MLGYKLLQVLLCTLLPIYLVSQFKKKTPEETKNGQQFVANLHCMWLVPCPLASFPLYNFPPFSSSLLSFFLFAFLPPFFFLALYFFFSFSLPLSLPSFLSLSFSFSLPLSLPYFLSLSFSFFLPPSFLSFLSFSFSLFAFLSIPFFSHCLSFCFYLSLCLVSPYLLLYVRTMTTLIASVHEKKQSSTT